MEQLYNLQYIANQCSTDEETSRFRSEQRLFLNLSAEA